VLLHHLKMVAIHWNVKADDEEKVAGSDENSNSHLVEEARS
jgi:hypothetical protein